MTATPPSLDPIPTPLSERRREFFVRHVPILVFLAAIAGVVSLWNQYGSGTSLVGVGVAPRTSLVSPQPALLATYLVEPYARVQRGDPIAVLQPYDPRAEFDRLRSRMDLSRLQNTPSLGQNNAVALERLRVELLQTRTDLALAKVRLDLAESELARNEPLFQERLVTADIFELSRSTRDLHRAEVNEKTQAIEALESRFAQLELDFAPQGLVPDPTLLQALDALQQATNLVLHAPEPGIVSPFLRFPGEFVSEGEPLLSIQHDRASQVVGYLRQPFTFDPQSGTPVTLTRRSPRRERTPSTILHVGPQFETITNALALIQNTFLIDAGLPIVIAVPDSYFLRPGELVDIRILPSTTPGPPEHLPFGASATLPLPLPSP